MLFRILATLAARPPTESSTSGNTSGTQSEQPAARGNKARASAPPPEPDRRISGLDMVGGFPTPAAPTPKRASTTPSPPPLVQPERPTSPPPLSATPAAQTLWQSSPSYTRQPSRDTTPPPSRVYETYASRRRSTSTSISVASSSTAVSTVSAAGAGGSSPPKRASETLKRVNSGPKPVVEEVVPVAEEAPAPPVPAPEVVVPPPQEKEVEKEKEDKPMSPLTEEPEEEAPDAPAADVSAEVPAEVPAADKQPEEEIQKVEEDTKPASDVGTPVMQVLVPERHVHFAASPETPSDEGSLYLDAVPGSSLDNDLEDADDDVPVVGAFEVEDKPAALEIPSRVEEDDPRTPIGRAPPQLSPETPDVSPDAPTTATAVPSTEDVPSLPFPAQLPTLSEADEPISPYTETGLLSPPPQNAPSHSADATADGASGAKEALPPSPLPLSLSLTPTAPPKPKLVLPTISPTTPTTANSGTAGSPRTPVSAIAVTHARLAHASSATLVHVRTPPSEGPIPLPATAILDAPAPEESGEAQDNAQVEAQVETQEETQVEDDHSPAHAPESLPEPSPSSSDDVVVVHPPEESEVSAERPPMDHSPVELGTDARFDVPRLRVQAPAVPFPLLGSPMSPIEARAAAARLVGEAASPHEKAGWRETVYVEAEDGERSGWESDEETEEGEDDRDMTIQKEAIHLDEEMQGGEGEVYEVINTKTGAAMDLSGADCKSVLGWDVHGNRNQQWVFNPWGKGFTVRSAWGGGYLGLEDGLDAGAELVVSDYPMVWRLDAIDGAENIFRIYWPNGKYAVGLEAGSNRVKLCSLRNLDAGYDWKFHRRPEREIRVQTVEAPRSPMPLPIPVPAPALVPAPAPAVAPEPETVSTTVTTRVQQDGQDVSSAPESKQIVVGSVHGSQQQGEWVEETITTTTVTTVTTVRRKRC